MNEKCVVTIRVMFNTDQEEKAKELAEILEKQLRGRAVLDVEITGYSFHGGRSFLYRDVPTKGDA